MAVRFVACINKAHSHAKKGCRRSRRKGSEWLPFFVDTHVLMRLPVCDVAFGHCCVGRCMVSTSLSISGSGVQIGACPIPLDVAMDDVSALLLHAVTHGTTIFSVAIFLVGRFIRGIMEISCVSGKGCF